MKLYEKTLNQKIVFEGRIITVRVDDAQLFDGTPCKREVVDHPGGVAILAVEKGYVYLVQQYRYPYGEVLLEIPAGKLDKDELPIRCAQRELYEEIGGACDKLNLITEVYPSPGYLREHLYIYEAEGLIVSSENSLDEGEYLDIIKVPLSDAYTMIENGHIKDAKTIIALQYYKLKNFIIK